MARRRHTLKQFDADGSASDALVVAGDQSVLSKIIATLERSGHRVSYDVAGCGTIQGQSQLRSAGIIVSRESCSTFVAVIRLSQSTQQLRTSAGGTADVHAYHHIERFGQLEAGRLAAVPHALLRWRHAIYPVIVAPRDTRTVADWGRLIAASPGAIRTWCHMAGIPSGRSLIFARLLRAMTLHVEGSQRFENALDVVDRRTLARMIRLAGGDLVSGPPLSMGDFLRRQSLVRDSAALQEVRCLLQEGHGEGELEDHLINKGI